MPGRDLVVAGRGPSGPAGRHRSHLSPGETAQVLPTLKVCSGPAIRITANRLSLSQFKSTANKNVSVVGWMVMMADDPEHPDLFLLTDSEKGESSEQPGVEGLRIRNFQ